MSGLDAIIDAEVNQNTRSYYIIQEYLKRVPVSTIIEIGASSGGGTTEALIKGVLNSPSKGNGVRMASVEVSRARFKNLKERYQDIPFFTPYNTSSVPLDKFPSDDDVRFFMKMLNEEMPKFIGEITGRDKSDEAGFGELNTQIMGTIASIGPQIIKIGEYIQVINQKIIFYFK